jgi:alpha-tubulin suppressor-like RCC1 family protein
MALAFDYSDGSAILTNYASNTYTLTTVQEMVDATTAARGAITDSQPTPPSASLRRSAEIDHIAKLPARLYVATVGGQETHLWYAESLPVPPDDVRRELEALDQLGASADDKSCDSDDTRVKSREIAGRTLLRAATKGSDGTWTTTVDTLSVNDVRLTGDVFAIPDGFSEVPLASPPTQIQAAYDSKVCGANDSPVAAVGSLGGPVLHNVRVSLDFVGSSFSAERSSDPGSFSDVLVGSVSQVLSPGYLSGLAQYGWQSSALSSIHVYGGALPSSDFVTDVAFVEGLMFSGGAPAFWWKTGPDPLVLIVTDGAENTSTPYHLAAPSPTYLLPFPVNFFANDFVPYALTIIPHDGLSVTSSQLASRDQLQCGGSCGPIYDLDAGTTTISHEVVEAISDPYPFSGWSNPAFAPVWDDGEIADICDLGCTNDTAVGRRTTRSGNTALSTYWSNAASACVGPWRPAIHIVAPAAGDVAWVPGGPSVSALASVADPVTQGDLAASEVSWAVDGYYSGSGAAASIWLGGTLGPHVVVATLQDAESGNTVTDTVTVNLVDVPATITITSPNDQATLSAGTPLALSGSVTNVDFPSGAPGSLLTWLVDGAIVGTGSSLTGPTPSLGDHQVTLQFTDSAHVTQSLTHVVHVVTTGPRSFQRQIAANNSHTCGLLPDGTVKCWGNDSWGELGDGDTLTTHVAPVAAVGLSGVVSLAAGEAATCALIYDGTVRCFGDNPAGELGNGTTTSSATPVVVGGITNATAITMGNDHACAILADQTVQCWGSNEYGQLGDGTTTSRSTPVLVGGLSDVTQIAAGGWWTCAVMANGTAACWGKQFFDPADSTGTDYGAVPTLITGLSNVVAVGAGEYHACALLGDSSLSCWGGNVWGQLGDGTATARATPAPVTGLTGVLSVTAGGFHTCVVMNDFSVECWGDNAAGQLGNGSSIELQSHPTAVANLSPVAAVAGGGEFTCALLKTGAAACWGSNYDGELGNPSVSSAEIFGSSSPVPVVGWP